MAKYYLYIARCSNGALYTGITTNVKRRVAEHNEGRLGAIYTKGRRPVTLVYQEQLADRSEASKREWDIKKMTKAQKEEIIKGAAQQFTVDKEN